MQQMDKGPSSTVYGTRALFDVESYPVDRPNSPEYGRILEQAIRGLNAISCAHLTGFIRPKMLVRMQSEAADLSGEAVFHEADLNPYFCEPQEGMPEDHPLNRFSPRRHGMVRADRFARDGVIWSVFQNAQLCKFVADALGYERLYPYRDPFAATNVNVQPDGCEFAWHFDNNEFTVSIGLKQSRKGGDFEYVPNLRSRNHENYEAVKRVLDGDETDIRRFKLKPGDLLLFRGGCTLHRVTAPAREERQSLLLSYVTDPEDIATSDKANRIWGEAHPDHYERDRQIVNASQDRSTKTGKYN